MRAKAKTAPLRVLKDEIKVCRLSFDLRKRRWLKYRNPGKLNGLQSFHRSVGTLGLIQTK